MVHPAKVFSSHLPQRGGYSLLKNRVIHLTHDEVVINVDTGKAEDHAIVAKNEETSVAKHLFPATIFHS